MDRTSSHSRFDPHHFRFTVTGAIRILLFGSHMHHIGLYCALVAGGYEAVVFLAVDRSIKSATTIADWSWTINVIIEMSMPALAVAFLARPPCLRLSAAGDCLGITVRAGLSHDAALRLLLCYFCSTFCRRKPVLHTESEALRQPKTGHSKT